MNFFQRLWKSKGNLLRRRFFTRARLDLDGPQPMTRDATIYLFRGIRIVGILKPSKHLILFNIWSVVINFLVTLYMPVGFLMSFILRISSFSPSEFLTSLQISVNCFGCSLKLIVFMFLYKRLLSALPYMDALDQRVEEKADKVEIRRAVAFGNRTCMMFTGLFLTYASSTFLSSVINGRPPYQLYNPFFEWKETTWNFCMQAGFEYFMIDFHCYQQALMDSYPVIFITIIRTHLHILTRRISKLGNDTTLTSDERFEALVQCVLDHKNIMHLYNIFYPVLSGTMFVQFLIIGLILGITTIHIILFADLLATIASLFYVASILAETFPCSFLANSLMDDSDSISLAIFHSDWPSEEPRYKQMIAFFLQHTQKTLILTAMKIFPITMNSNINVVKFAFSVFTLMKQMDFGQNLKETITGEEEM